MLCTYDDTANSLRHSSMKGSKGENESSESGDNCARISARKFESVYSAYGVNFSMMERVL